MKSKPVQSSVLSGTSVFYSNRVGGKSIWLSMVRSELQLELTGSVMTSFLYLFPCT